MAHIDDTDWDRLDRDQRILDEIAAQGLIDLRKATNHFMYLWEQDQLGGVAIVPWALTYVLEFVQYWYSDMQAMPDAAIQAQNALYTLIQEDLRHVEEVKQSLS